MAAIGSCGGGEGILEDEIRGLSVLRVDLRE